LRLLVLGGDGYVGWPVALRFSARGCDVCVLENFDRRRWLRDAARRSLTPIRPWDERRAAWESLTGRRIGFIHDDLRRPGCAADAIDAFEPDAIVHLAGQPSARWAAENVEQAVATFETNLFASLRVLWAIAERAPHVHLVKLGTMGEYGRPDVDICEGDVELVHRGRRETMPFPQRPDTLYDLSKRHDSDNALFAARAWNLRVTILRQSAVYGVNTAETGIDPRLVTRFDYDTAFGAAVNRFCAQALALGEISVHGDAEAAYPLILLEDAVRCIELAVAHPPQAGDPAVCNQLGQIAPLRAMAGEVARAAAAIGDPTTVVHTDPAPRRPTYRAASVRLPALGFRPTPMSEAVLGEVMQTLRPHRGRILPEAFGHAHRPPALSGAHA
jgi:UDP-sulfoquinovose synthase